MTSLSIASKNVSSSASTTAHEAALALAEAARATDPDAARDTLRRAVFHDRLPSVDMAGDAYLVLRDALLPRAEDDFARRADVVAAVMIARGEGRLRLSLEAEVAEALARMKPATRRSAAAWLLGQLYDGGVPRVALVNERDTARRLQLARSAD